MKILYYSPHPHLNLADKAGYGTHMREMIEAFRQLGHEVLPVINGGTEQKQSERAVPPSALKKIIKSLTPKIIWRSLKDRRLLKYDKTAELRLEKIADEFKPDLIYERAYYMQVSGVNVAKKKKIRHFLEVNAPYIEETAEFEKAPTLFHQKALENEIMQLKLSDKVIVVSSSLKDYFLKKDSSINGSKLVVIPNCVNTAKVKVKEEVKKKAIEKYSLKDHVVFGFVGSIFPYHGVDIMIDAFNSVYAVNKNVKLLIVGDGIIAPQLKEYSKTLPASASIIFTGNVSYEDVFSHIDVMDVTLLADTKWYCSPIKIFEYGILGKAIIAPDTKAVRDAITPNTEGILVKPIKESVAEAMLDLAAHKSKREKLGEAFRKKILDQFTWVKAAESLLRD